MVTTSADIFAGIFVLLHSEMFSTLQGLDSPHRSATYNCNFLPHPPVCCFASDWGCTFPDTNQIYIHKYFIGRCLCLLRCNPEASLQELNRSLKTQHAYQQSWQCAFNPGGTCSGVADQIGIDRNSTRIQSVFNCVSNIFRYHLKLEVIKQNLITIDSKFISARSDEPSNFPASQPPWATLNWNENSNLD